MDQNFWYSLIHGTRNTFWFRFLKGIKEPILNIREKLYEGKDYLPHLIDEWSGTFPKNTVWHTRHATFENFCGNDFKISNEGDRQNFILIDSKGQIIGFFSLSYYFHIDCKYFVEQEPNICKLWIAHGFYFRWLGNSVIEIGIAP